MDQSVPGAEVIALGFHVTYWDDLGWKDPFSLQIATERQQQYSRIFGADRIYTPQTVIDGREERIGSDGAAVRDAIARAAKEPHTRIAIRPTFTPDVVRATLVVAGLPEGIKEPCDLLFFVTEGGLATQVKRGENGGRTLHHDAVVRDMTKVATIDDKTRFPLQVEAVSRSGREEALRPTHPWLVVAIVQGRRSGRIWASGIR